MDYHTSFGILAGLVSVVSCVRYLAAIWRERHLKNGKKPNRVTYWIWFVMSSAIFFSYLKSGGTTIWLQFTYVLNPFLIALVSLKYGEQPKEEKEGVEPKKKGLSTLDKICLAIAAVSVPLWIWLRSRYGDTPEAALPILLLNLGADAAGGVPTFVKAWKRPETEDKAAWIICSIGSVLNLFAVREWGIPDILWNGYMTSAAFFVTYAACFRPSSVTGTSRG